VCIDLKERFGRRYRVEYEESYYAEYGPNVHTHDPWYMILPCQKGHIFPHGDNLLGVATNSRGPVVKRLQAIRGLRILQDGDDGINAVFLVDVFEDVAKVMNPRRRRRLSPEQKAQAVARLRKHQFSPAAQGRENERTRIAQPSPDTSPT
jgi:hypothetical protein